MHVTLHPVPYEEKDILRNLLEKYRYDFSVYEDEDVNEFGLFGYKYLDHYWTEENRWPFFIRADGKLAGCALVNDVRELRREDGQYNMAEFFILQKYRRRGVGREAALALFRRFPGRWELMRHPGNLPSVAFWDRVIGEVAKRKELHTGVTAFTYGDGTPAEVWFFDT